VGDAILETLREVYGLPETRSPAFASDPRFRWEHLPDDASAPVLSREEAGCLPVVLWPVISAAVVITQAIATPSVPAVWERTAIAMAVLYVLLFLGPGDWYTEAYNRLVDRLVPPGGPTRARVRTLLANEELVRAIAVPVLVGTISALLSPGVSPLPAILVGVAAGAVLLGLALVDTVRERGH
jgi:hypothetical protein